MVSVNKIHPISFQKLNLKNVSMIRDFPNTFLADNFDLSWDVERLCKNPSVSPENLFRLARSEKMYEKNEYVCFENISANPNLNLEDVASNPDIRWNWHSISSRDDLYLSFIKQHLDLPWNWNRICAHKNITWRQIEENPDLPWCWFWLSDNPNITRDIIGTNLDKPWDYSFLSWNPTITFEFVLQTHDKSWDWDILSQNSGFVNSMIEAQTVRGKFILY